MQDEIYRIDVAKHKNEDSGVIYYTFLVRYVDINGIINYVDNGHNETEQGAWSDGIRSIAEHKRKRGDINENRSQT